MSIHNTEISPDSLGFSLNTFGSNAPVKQINETLRLDERIQDLPQDAQILNLGAGIYLGVNTLIHTLRPNAHIVNVDPGYAYTQPEIMPIAESDRAYIQTQTGVEPIVTGEQHHIAALAEQLPFADNTYDYVFGHASIPENMLQSPANEQAVLRNLSRVAKQGALIDLGPLKVDLGDRWEGALNQAVNDGHFASAKVLSTEVYIEDYDLRLTALTTVIER